MSESQKATQMVVLLLVAALMPHPDNPRDLENLSAAEKADLLALGQSMMETGQRQPVRCVKVDGERYVLISGHRRWMAARLVGMRSLSAIVLDAMPSRVELLVDQLIENGQREDFNDLQKLDCYTELMTANGWTAKQLSRVIHVSEGQIAKVVALGLLNPGLQDQVRAGALKGSYGYQIARVPDHQEQNRLFEKVKGGMSRDALIIEVNGILKGKVKERKPKALTLKLVVEKTAAGLEALKTLAREIAAEIERLAKLQLAPETVADTVARKFAKGG